MFGVGVEGTAARRRWQLLTPPPWTWGEAGLDAAPLPQLNGVREWALGISGTRFSGRGTASAKAVGQALRRKLTGQAQEAGGRQGTGLARSELSEEE